MHPGGLLPLTPGLSWAPAPPLGAGKDKGRGVFRGVEMTCRHCQRRKAALWRRGLCGTCFRQADIRRQYPHSPLPPPAPLCKHCNRNRGQRWKRGLCLGCYMKPAVRERYPPRYCSTAGRPWQLQGEDFNGPGTTPEPTRATPGSLEKIAALRERAGNRQALWHRDDATFADVPAPVFADEADE